MIKSIKIESWCISCRNCETVCPKIFRVNPTSKVISNEFVGNETEILMAEAMCPVNVIKVEKKWTVNLNFKESEVFSKKYLTSDIIELVVEKPINFSFKAGQYISVMFEDWKWKFSRQYSIAWENSESFALTIRLAEKWRWAAKLKKLKVWQKIKFLWALGGFYLQNTEKEKYFISTGTWLAPFIAMAEKTAPEVKKHFIIWARKKEEFYYTERLKSFENTEIHYYLSGEEIESRRCRNLYLWKSCNGSLSSWLYKYKLIQKCLFWRFYSFWEIWANLERNFYQLKNSFFKRNIMVFYNFMIFICLTFYLQNWRRNSLW